MDGTETLIYLEYSDKLMKNGISSHGHLKFRYLNLVVLVYPDFTSSL